MGTLTIISTIISAIVSPIRDYLSSRKEIKKAENDLALAKLAAEAEAVKAGYKADQAITQYSLEATTPFFKSTSFYLLVTPIIITCIAPLYGKEIWENLTLVPEWYRQLFAAVFLTIWGIRVVPDMVKNIFNGIAPTLESRREYKIEKIKALNESKFFAELRRTIFKQGLTQAQVDAIHKAIDEGQSDS